MCEGTLSELALEKGARRGMDIVIVIAHNRLNDGFIIAERVVKTAFVRFIAVLLARLQMSPAYTTKPQPSSFIVRQAARRLRSKVVGVL